MWSIIRPGSDFLQAKSYKELHASSRRMIAFSDNGKTSWMREWEKTDPEVALIQLEPGDMV